MTVVNLSHIVLNINWQVMVNMSWEYICVINITFFMCICKVLPCKKAEYIIILAVQCKKGVSIHDIRMIRQQVLHRQLKYTLFNIRVKQRKLWTAMLAYLQMKWRVKPSNPRNNITTQNRLNLTWYLSNTLVKDI